MGVARAWSKVMKERKQKQEITEIKEEATEKADNRLKVIFTKLNAQEITEISAFLESENMDIDMLVDEDINKEYYHFFKKLYKIQKLYIEDMGGSGLSVTAIKNIFKKLLTDWAGGWSRNAPTKQQPK